VSELWTCVSSTAPVQPAGIASASLMTGGRKRRFCSDACKQAGYRAREQARQRAQDDARRRQREEPARRQLDRSAVVAPVADTLPNEPQPA
jgi:hypothetical protein